MLNNIITILLMKDKTCLKNTKTIIINQLLSKFTVETIRCAQSKNC